MSTKKNHIEQNNIKESTIKKNEKYSKKQEEISDVDSNMYLTFSIGNESYGIDVKNVVEIMRIPMITPIPDVYHFIKGVINLRGKIVPVIDFRCRLELSSIEYDDRTCIIVVQFQDINVGIIVDRVSDVLTVPIKIIEPKPNVNTTRGSRFITGIIKVNENIKSLLDIEKILLDLTDFDIESKNNLYLEKMQIIEHSRTTP